MIFPFPCTNNAYTDYIYGNPEKPTETDTALSAKKRKTDRAIFRVGSYAYSSVGNTFTFDVVMEKGSNLTWSVYFTDRFACACVLKYISPRPPRY